MQLGAVNTWYDEHGEGEPLVLMHGGLDCCGFCGGADGPFTRVEGASTVLVCPRCLAQRARGRGPYPDLTNCCAPAWTCCRLGC